MALTVNPDSAFAGYLTLTKPHNLANLASTEKVLNKTAVNAVTITLGN